MSVGRENARPNKYPLYTLDKVISEFKMRWQDTAHQPKKGVHINWGICFILIKCSMWITLYIKFSSDWYPWNVYRISSSIEHKRVNIVCNICIIVGNCNICTLQCANLQDNGWKFAHRIPNYVILRVNEGMGAKLGDTFFICWITLLRFGKKWWKISIKDIFLYHPKSFTLLICLILCNYDYKIALEYLYLMLYEEITICKCCPVSQIMVHIWRSISLPIFISFPIWKNQLLQCNPTSKKVWP